jgi:hypothetical protein
MQPGERKIADYRKRIDATDSGGVRKQLREDIETEKRNTLFKIPRNREWDMEAHEMLSMIHVLFKL